MKRLFSLLGYLVYALVVLAVLAYVRFPGDKVLGYVEGQLALRLPGSSWQVAGAEYVFPWLLVASDIRGRWPESERSLLLDRLGCDFSSLLSRMELLISGRFYGGSLEADLAFSGHGGQLRLERVVLSGLNLADLSTDFKLAGRQVRGLLTLAGSYRFPAPQLLGGAGAGRVEVREGEVELLHAVLGLDRLPFTNLTANLSYDGGRLMVADGRLSSPLLTADFAGDMVVQASPAQVRMSLRGSMIPTDALLARIPREQRWVVEVARKRGQQVIPFSVGGTLAAPTILFFK